MSLRQELVLRASAIWAVWVWAVLVRNMLTDHRDGLAFEAVHIALAVVSIAFAFTSWRIASLNRRRRSSAA